MRTSALLAVLVVFAAPTVSFAQYPDTQQGQQEGPSQEPQQQQPPPSGGQSEQEPKHVLGIVPNFRSSPTLEDYQPLTPKQKFRIASEDAFDRGTFALAGLFAADGELMSSTPAFGGGVGGFARYYAASLTDFVDGDFMTEGIFPTVLREDPRYFRRGIGSKWSRLGYAIGQIFWTHTDDGGTRLNVSELAGNAAAVGISNAYYPGGQTVASNAAKWGVQIGVDMASNVLKEFWPDLDQAVARLRARHRHAPGPTQ